MIEFLWNSATILCVFAFANEKRISCHVRQSAWMSTCQFSSIIESICIKFKEKIPWNWRHYISILTPKFTSRLVTITINSIVSCSRVRFLPFDAFLFFPLKFSFLGEWDVGLWQERPILQKRLMYTTRLVHAAIDLDYALRKVAKIASNRMWIIFSLPNLAFLLPPLPKKVTILRFCDLFYLTHGQTSSF